MRSQAIEPSERERAQVQRHRQFPGYATRDTRDRQFPAYVDAVLGSALTGPEPSVPRRPINGHVEEDEKPSTKGAPRLQGLDGSRFFAACCIISYHFYDKLLGSIAHGGSCWVSYFFFLSGFVMAYREYTTPLEVPRLSPLKYLKYRLVTVYPIYIFTLLTVIFEATRLDHTDFEWHCLPLQFIMVQAWFPICSHWNAMVHDYQCCSTTWNSIAWFMSTIIPYWLIGRQVARLFRRATVLACFVGMASLWLWTIVPSVIAHLNVDKLPGIRTWDFLMAGPFGYWHVFTFGFPAARLFIKLGMYDTDTGGEVTTDTVAFAIKEPGRVHWTFHWGAVIGYSCIFLFLGLGRANYDFHWAFYHSGGFLPFLLLIAMGLGSGYDPLAKYAMATGPFVLLGAMSYSMYLLQFRIWWLLVCIRGKDPSLALYPLILLVTAFMCYVTIQVPYTQWQRWRGEKGKLGTDDKVIDFIEGKLVMLGGVANEYLSSMYMFKACEEDARDSNDDSGAASRNWLLAAFSRSSLNSSPDGIDSRPSRESELEEAPPPPFGLFSGPESDDAHLRQPPPKLNLT